MRAVLQRVQSSSVVVDNQTVGAIQKGTLVLLGVAQGDTPGDAIALADKTVGLRIFDDEAGKMNLSIADVGGAILVVSQFTLLADCRKGRRPNFLQAAPPDQAKNLYEIYCEQIRKLGIPVQQGIFQANMQVSLINDGPVTIVLESPANSPSA